MSPLPDRGVIAALWTPTDADGRILEPALKENLEFLRARRIHGLMVLGSTGEFVHLDVATRRQLLASVRALAPSLPAITNVSDVRPATVAELGRTAHALGYEAIALLPPWFFPLAESDLVEFFVRGAEAARLPVFLYNFPERTGHRLTLETIAAVAARVPVAGVKQSGAEFGYHRDLVALGRERGFIVLTGADGRFAEALALGVTGCVSGLANVVPELLGALYAAVPAADAAVVLDLTNRMNAVVRLVETLEFPLNIAAAMAGRGRPTGAPKTIISPATQGRYEALQAGVRQLCQELKLG